MKLKIIFEDESQFDTEEVNSEILLNDEIANYSLRKISPTEFLLIKDHKVYNVRDVQRDSSSWSMKINGQLIQMSVKDQLAQILEDLGMNAQEDILISDLNAPMPGAILDILINEGDDVVTGQTLIILEAMKMENNIKCPIDGKITRLHVGKNQKVEKGQVLVSF